MKVKYCTCEKCGQENIPVSMSRYHPDKYEVIGIKCPSCGAKSTGGNFKTGIIDSWMTQKAIDDANEWYRRQTFETKEESLLGW